MARATAAVWIQDSAGWSGANDGSGNTGHTGQPRTIRAARSVKHSYTPRALPVYQPSGAALCSAAPGLQGLWVGASSQHVWKFEFQIVNGRLLHAVGASASVAIS